MLFAEQIAQIKCSLLSNNRKSFGKTEKKP